MPKRFTPQQLAASAAVGELRTEQSFAGDTDAWHAYQQTAFSTLMLGEVLPPVGDGERAKRWKAARRQRGKIEEQRTKDAAAGVTLVADENDGGQLRKRLKVSARWQAKNAAGLGDLNVSTPVASST